MNYSMPPTWMLLSINALAWTFVSVWLLTGNKKGSTIDPIVAIFMSYVLSGTIIMGGTVIFFK